MLSKKLLQSGMRRLIASKHMITPIPQKGFSGGGEKIPPMPQDVNDFDVVIVGGINATAIGKFIQNEGSPYKMALITDRTRFVKPEVYFFASYGQIPELKLESGTVSSQVKNQSRVDAPGKVTKFIPEQNKVVLSNGREYTYKALVLATGFDHKAENIKGLADFEQDRGENKVFVHAIDTKQRLERNYYHGWSHSFGDMLVYSPQFPYKGEGSDFYAFYYEHINRQDKLHARSAKSARIQYWTPNKKIFKFDYANEFALDQCEKRGIDVMFGWEMIEVKQTPTLEKIAIFKNVDTGEVIERSFSTMSINPKSLPQKELVDAGLTNEQGLVDVNQYTLQHKKFDNILAFGDCIAGETHRTQYAAASQTPIIKNNLNCLLHGQKLNGIYDGYTYLPLLLGQTQGISFQHYWDYEPHPLNHVIPSYGIFSHLYFKRMVSFATKFSDKYAGFKATVGPPYWNFTPEYYPVELNRYLTQRSIDIGTMAPTISGGGLTSTGSEGSVGPALGSAKPIPGQASDRPKKVL